MYFQASNIIVIKHHHVMMRKCFITIFPTISCSNKTLYHIFKHFFLHIVLLFSAHCCNPAKLSFESIIPCMESHFVNELFLYSENL